MAPLGFDPRTIDTMEVQEAASILLRYADDDDDIDDGGRDLVAERLAYREGRGPKPEPDAPRPDPPALGSVGFVDLGRPGSG